MHPTALLKATALKSTHATLGEATALAAARGVRDVPAVSIPGGGRRTACSTATTICSAQHRRQAPDARPLGLPADRHAHRPQRRRGWRRPTASTTSRSSASTTWRLRLLGRSRACDGRLEALLRADLDALDPEEFYARWAAFDASDL